MNMGLVRNLEQIQEADRKPPGSRLGTLLLVSLGGACVIFAILSQTRRKAEAPAPKVDPLGDLVAQAHAPSALASSELAGKDVTFPGILSDDPRTTTALVATRPTSSAPVASAPSTPPPPTDRLPVVPLPAKNVVAPSPVVTRPRDVLTQMAKEASSLTTSPAEEGRPGGYQLQASSFRSEPEAIAFASALRQRGHRAYMDPAAVEGRGTWYRVRIGPFKTKREALQYRADFEEREHLAPFIVEPPRDKGSPKKP
jgi:cell division septation protein DedD